MDELELQYDEIDRFKQSIMDDDDDDDDVYDLDDSDSFDGNNPFEINNNDDSDTDDDDDEQYDSFNQQEDHKGDRMWFRHHLGHLKVLKKFFREMDKDGDGTISFDEFTKFLSKYSVNKKFKPDEIERFFLKITDVPFDADNPNEIENKMTNMISPALISHDYSKDNKNDNNNSKNGSNSKLNARKSGISKKTSIFFKKNKTAPSGEVDMATFLFYFSSPIDSQAMMNQKLNINEIEFTQTERETIISNDYDYSKQSMILPDKIRSSKYAKHYSKAAAIAANKAKLKKINNDIDTKIDASLLFSTKKKKKSKGMKRQSLGVKSSGKKLKKRVNKQGAKRGSITALSEYHSHKRVSKGNLDNGSGGGLLDVSRSISDINYKKSQSVPRTSDINSGLNAMSLLLNRESINKYKNLKIDTNSSNSSLLNTNSKNNQSLTMDNLIKLMRRNIQLQDRKNNGILWKDCFIGRDLVTWFLNKEYINNRHSGLLLGRKLFMKGYIKYAGNEERDFEDEIRFFYQFTDKELNNNSDNVSDLYDTSSNNPSFNNDDSKSQTQTQTNSDNINNDDDIKDGNDGRYSTLTNDTPVPMCDNNNNDNDLEKAMEYTQSTSKLMEIITKMRDSIERSSYRSTTLLQKKDIFSGAEIIDWFIKYEYCKNRIDGINYGSYIRRQGLIRHIEFHPTFKDEQDQWYIINLFDDNNNHNGHTISVLYNKNENKNHKFDMGMGHIMEDEVNTINNNNDPLNNAMRATMPAKYGTGRSHNDSIVSNFTTDSNGNNSNTNNTKEKERTSLVLGQMGRGRATRSRKREQLVQDLFTFIIRSQILTNQTNMNSETLYAMDMIIDGVEHSHINKLLNKIEIKFYKCDEHDRGSLSLEEFNRFLMKCGVILHQQDLNVIFKIFDKNNTGLIDYSNFAENSLVHRVPGIKTENLTVTHLIKHTISVNFGISSGKRGFDDQYTKIAMAIAAAFEEINTSATGEITLNEFKLSYRKNGIEIYGGVTQIFERLCSANKQTISLANFIEAFQGTIFANRAEAPKLKEILSKLGIIQWTLGNNNNMNNNSNNPSDIGGEEDSINTITKTNRLITPNHHNIGITPHSITPSGISSQENDGRVNNIIQNEPLLNNNNNGYIISPPNDINSPTTSTTNTNTNTNKIMIINNNGLGQVKEELIIETNNTIPLSTNRTKRSLTNDLKSPHVQIRLNLHESFDKVLSNFFKSTIIISLPGVILNSLLHFLQAIRIDNDFPLIDLTWYIFGFLVYLALQSTMVGVDVTKSLIIFYLIIAISIGTLLAINTIVGYYFYPKTMGSDYGIGWWTGLFVVYLICECAARLKYMKIFGAQRTRREYVWYALKSAIGVTLFWFIQTFVSLIVVNVSFSSSSSIRRWPIILYCALTLTVIRNISLNSLGTAFIARLSDHFYLEDVEMMELRTDQMLLTQLSIISSYSSLWYLFTKTYLNDWNWVICGILTYQFILLFMDIFLAEYIRKKMISLLKGELIAWFTVGAKVMMDFIFPFHTTNTHTNNNNNINYTIIWFITYLCGPVLLLLLLWLRIYKIWSYDNVENYWDFEEFNINLFKNKNNKIDENSNKNKSNNKQRNRLMIICLLTIGFIVSVTEAVSIWSDNPDTLQYEGFVNLDF